MYVEGKDKMIKNQLYFFMKNGKEYVGWNTFSAFQKQRNFTYSQKTKQKCGGL
jgi:hypothetical protein